MASTGLQELLQASKKKAKSLKLVAILRLSRLLRPNGGRDVNAREVETTGWHDEALVTMYLLRASYSK